jgi:hypothetical protein
VLVIRGEDISPEGANFRFSAAALPGQVHSLRCMSVTVQLHVGADIGQMAVGVFVRRAFFRGLAAVKMVMGVSAGYRWVNVVQRHARIPEER